MIASIFMLGGQVLAALRVLTATAMHGYSHTLETPAGDPGRYMLGFWATTALLQGSGLGLGRVVQTFTGNLGLRGLGRAGDGRRSVCSRVAPGLFRGLFPGFSGELARFSLLWLQAGGSVGEEQGEAG